MKIFMNNTATKPYHLSQDTDKEVTWLIGVVDSSISLYLSEKYGSAKDTGKNAGMMVDLVRFGVKGLDGVDESGAKYELPMEEMDVPYLGKYSVVAESFLKRLSPVIVSELANQVLLENFLSAEEKKR